MQPKRQLLFVQGGGEGAHDEWDDKLVGSLRQELGSDFDIRYPRMPDEDNPDYALWKPALEQELDTLQGGAVLVGHSVGATILIRLLAEHIPVRELGGIFLVAAPFTGDGGWSSDDVQFSHGLGAQLPKGVPIHFYQGLEDKTVPPSHARLYAQAIPQACVHCLPGRDHQLNNDLSGVASDILLLEATLIR